MSCDDNEESYLLFAKNNNVDDDSSPSSAKKKDNFIIVTYPSTSTASLVITLLLVSLSVLALSLSLHHTASSSSSSSSSSMAAETNINENIEKVVYIIRHGEKHWDPKNETAYKYACLSTKGYARADQLVSVFAGTKSTTSTTSPTTADDNNDDDDTHLITPNGLFSFNYDNNLDCRDVSNGVYRTQATLHPLSMALKIPVNNITGSKP
jgi:hypothetical protein